MPPFLRFTRSFSHSTVTRSAAVRGSAYRAPTGPGYPWRCPGLYTVPGRAVFDLSQYCLSTRPSHCAPSALRGSSAGATMTIAGEAGTLPFYRTLQLPYVLGAPATIIGSELPWLTGSGLYTVLGRALWTSPSAAFPFYSTLLHLVLTCTREYKTLGMCERMSRLDD